MNPMTALRFITVIAIAMLHASPAAAATFNVTRGDDPAPDGCVAGDCSLREAVDATVATPESDTIMLGAGQYRLTQGSLVVGGEIAIEGLGSASTRIVGEGDAPAIHVAPFGELRLDGVELGNPDDSALDVDDNAFAWLRDVSVPPGAGAVGTVLPPGDVGSGSIRIEDSTIGDALGCLQPQGVCRVFDSRVKQVLVKGSEIEMKRVVVDGEGTAFFGVSIESLAPVTIEDATITHQSTPLRLYDAGGSAPTVSIRRTRFLDNTGPIGGTRASIVQLEDVEFRRHRVDSPSPPAVLYAETGPAWFFHRALIAGNRGGNGQDGAAVRVRGGGRAIFDNSTFDDNTFRTDFGAGYGDTASVYNTTNTQAILWFFHTTMIRSPYVDDDAPGSLVTVRGTPSSVIVENSLLQGTCAFGSGGAITQAAGNVESGGDTCGFDPSTNRVDIAPVQLLLSSLGDHGGFTDTYLPGRSSVLVDAADAAMCDTFGALDQRGYARDPEGVACDIGAVEAGAVADLLFAGDFED